MAEARAMKTSIINIHARQVFCADGYPTVEVDLQTELGLFRAAAPSDCSLSRSVFVASELRDGGNQFGGLGVSKALKNVETTLLSGIRGMNRFPAGN